MMRPLFESVYFLAYLLLRFIIHVIRDVIWRVNGTRKLIQDSKLSVNYDRSAQVMTIIGRGKLDLVLPSNKVDDFITIHNGFVHPTYVCSDVVTLYHVSPSQAVFVECLPGDDPWDVSRYNFFKRGQFLTARKLISMPLRSAQRLAEQIGDPKGKLIILPNVARCGSTLMCQIFDVTGRFRTFSEPGVLENLMPWVGLECYPWVRQMGRTVVRLLCKQVLDHDKDPIEGFIIKPMSIAAELTNILLEVYPEASYVLIYRDIKPVLQSTYRLCAYLPYAVAVTCLPVCLQKCINRYYNVTYCGDGGDFIKNGSGVKSPYARLAGLPFLVYFMYFRWRQQGRNVIAVKFEDLVQDPMDSLERIFTSCGVSHDLISSAMEAFKHDSQRKTITNKTQFDNIKVPYFGSDDLHEIKLASELWDIPNVVDGYIFPGTITQSGDRPA